MPSPSKNIFWLTLSRAAALAMLFVGYTQLFRYLGPVGTGQYQFALAYVTLFGVVIDFGLQQYIIKKMTEQPERLKQHFQTFLAIESVLAVVVYATLASIALLTVHDTPKLLAILVAGLGTAVNGLTYPFLAVLSAKLDLKRVAFINLFNSLINVGMIAATILLRHYIVFLAGNQLIFGLAGLVLYNWFVRRHIPRPDIFRVFRVLDRDALKRTFAAALPFALLVGFSTLYNRIDVLLINWRLGDAQTGLYTAAYKYFDTVAFFPSVVSYTLYPLLTASMVQQALGTVRRYLEVYMRFMLALAIPMGIITSILAQPIILLLSGSKYAAAAPTLAILAWAPVVLFAYIVANSLVISQLTKFAVMITGINVIVNVAGNLLLLPHLGIRGAALMTVVSELLQGLFYFYFVWRKITHFSIGSSLWRIALAGGAMAGVLQWLYRPSAAALSQVGVGLSAYVPLIVGIAKLSLISGAIYVLVLAVLGFFRREDWQFVKNFFKPRPNATPEAH